MPDRVRKAERETPKKEKICKTCGRAFAWRKKWEKDWDVVKYCSDGCRGSKPGEKDAALEAAILRLLAERGREKTICPSEAAKEVGGKDDAAGLGGVDGAGAGGGEEAGGGGEDRDDAGWAGGGPFHCKRGDPFEAALKMLALRADAGDSGCF